MPRSSPKTVVWKRMINFKKPKKVQEVERDDWKEEVERVLNLSTGQRWKYAPKRTQREQ